MGQDDITASGTDREKSTLPGFKLEQGAPQRKKAKSSSTGGHVPIRNPGLRIDPQPAFEKY
jgi:hypothetical protein